MLCCMLPVATLAQTQTTQLGGGSAQPFAPPNTSIPGPTITISPPPPARPPASGNAAAGAPTQAMPQVPIGQAALAVSARFGRENPSPIGSGLVWRVFSARPDPVRGLRPLKEERTAAPVFVLPVGDYVVHVSFGLATQAKPISLRSETTREVFDLPAGGIRLEGRVGDAKIPPNQITFDVYRGSQFDTGDRQPIAQTVMTGELVVVPEGTYYIVSNYGDGNAVVRSDIRVQAGKLTDVAVNHRAAVITLKLVTNTGGEALANTEWTVLTPGGDVIKESTGAFPKVILAEGEYRAIARNETKTFEREFKVTTGVDGEIEVLAR
jgi:hypothetical protein